MQIDVNTVATKNLFTSNSFCSYSGSGDIGEKPKFPKQLDVFFRHSLYSLFSQIYCTIKYDGKISRPPKVHFAKTGVNHYFF